MEWTNWSVQVGFKLLLVCVIEKWGKCLGFVEFIIFVTLFYLRPTHYLSATTSMGLDFCSTSKNKFLSQTETSLAPTDWAKSERRYLEDLKLRT